ncbi:MAG TPA: hypothetical protein VFY06_13300 [Verrucomicrobiae bacterium]|nr:hypothetical protein [Verrucomicrobiae bacterium]
MKTIIACFLVVVALALLTGCTTGSHNVTGTIGPPVSPDKVVIYDTMPANAKIIGKVSAHSFAGLTAANAHNYALAKAKSEAGALGANGLVVEDVPDVALDGARVRGDAILVFP